MSHRDRVDNPGTVSGRRSLALPTEVPRSCDRYRMTCQRTRTPLAQALLHQEIPGLRSRRRHSCTDHSVAHVCASASVPRSYRVSHMLGSGSPHPVLTPTPPVIQAVASLQSRDASRRCRQLPAKFVRCCSARPKAKPLVAPLDMAASGSSGGNAGALQLLLEFTDLVDRCSTAGRSLVRNAQRGRGVLG